MVAERTSLGWVHIAQIKMHSMLLNQCEAGSESLSAVRLKRVLCWEFNYGWTFVELAQSVQGKKKTQRKRQGNWGSWFSQTCCILRQLLLKISRRIYFRRFRYSTPRLPNFCVYVPKYEPIVPVVTIWYLVPMDSVSI